MQRERKRRFGVNAIISLTDDGVDVETSLSLSLSASLSLFSALTLSSHAHLRSLKQSLKNNGASFRKFIRTFGSTGLAIEPNKIFGSVLWSAAVPRSFQHCNRPIHRDSV